MVTGLRFEQPQHPQATWHVEWPWALHKVHVTLSHVSFDADRSQRRCVQSTTPAYESQNVVTQGRGLPWAVGMHAEVTCVQLGNPGATR